MCLKQAYTHDQHWLTNLFLMYRNCFCKCGGPCEISGKQDASCDVILSNGNLLLNAAPSKPGDWNKIIYSLFHTSLFQWSCSEMCWWQTCKLYYGLSSMNHKYFVSKMFKYFLTIISLLNVFNCTPIKQRKYTQGNSTRFGIEYFQKFHQRQRVKNLLCIGSR